MNVANFEKIINEFKDDLLNFAFYKIGSYNDALDITQNVFIKLFEKKIDFSNIDNVKPYLYKSVYNACIDYKRKQKFEVISIENNIQIQDVNIKESFAIAEEYDRINKILNKIPEAQAEIVKLRIIDDLSFKEISELTDINVATVKSRFKYGINKLKNILSKKTGG